MKRFIVFFCALALTFASQANDFSSKNEKEKPSKKAEKTTNNNSKKNNSKKTNESEEHFSEEKEVESDSSYYSVNKFNILFYFVYKLKYGEDELPSEE